MGTVIVDSHWDRRASISAHSSLIQAQQSYLSDNKVISSFLACLIISAFGVLVTSWICLYLLWKYIFLCVWFSYYVFFYSVWRDGTTFPQICLIWQIWVWVLFFLIVNPLYLIFSWLLCMCGLEVLSRDASTFYILC